MTFKNPGEDLTMVAGAATPCSALLPPRSSGGRGVGPVDPKSFSDQLKSLEAPLPADFSCVACFNLYLCTFLFGCEECSSRMTAPLRFRGPFPHRYMLMCISEDGEGAPRVSRAGKPPLCSPAGWITAPGIPGAPLRRPTAAPLPAPLLPVVPALTGLQMRAAPAFFWLRWICQRLRGCPVPPFIALASIELKYVKELPD